jgi:tRNA threonylcarbamoyladenosine biosynthesis protein TsaE
MALNKVYKNISIKQIESVAADVFSLIEAPMLVLLVGEVGSGKTEFLKHLMKKFGVDSIASPTFSLHHRYQVKGGLHFVHVDLYRLKSEEDLESTGFWDLFENQNSVILVEWSNLINDLAWPMNWKKIKLMIHRSNESRDYELSVLS